MNSRYFQFKLGKLISDFLIDYGPTSTQKYIYVSCFFKLNSVQSCNAGTLPQVNNFSFGQLFPCLNRLICFEIFKKLYLHLDTISKQATSN